MDQLASVGNFFTQQALPYAGNIAGRGINTLELANALAGHAEALPHFLALQQQLLQDPAFRQAAGQSPFTAGLVGQGLQQQQPDLNAFAAGLQPGQSGQVPGARAVPTLPALTPANQLAQDVTGAEAGILQDPATLRRVALAGLGVKPTFAENLQQLVDLGQPVSAGGGFQIKSINPGTGGITLGTRPAPEPDLTPTSVPGVFYSPATGKYVTRPAPTEMSPETRQIAESLGLLQPSSGAAPGPGNIRNPPQNPPGFVPDTRVAQPTATPTEPSTTTTLPVPPPPSGEGWTPFPGVTPPAARTGFPPPAPGTPAAAPQTTTPQLPTMQPGRPQVQGRLSIGPRGTTLSVAQPSINQQRARATETTDLGNLTQGISAGRTLLGLLEKGSPGEPLIGLKPGQAATGPLTSKALQTLSTYRGDPILTNLLGEKFNTQPVDIQFQALNSLTSDLNLVRFVLSGKRLTAAELTVFQGALPNVRQPPQVFRARVIGMLNLAERLMAVKSSLGEVAPDQRQVIEEQLVRGVIADTAAAQGVRLDPNSPIVTVTPQMLGGQAGPTGNAASQQDVGILNSIR